MSLNLRDEDRRALDLLLDRSHSAAASRNGDGDVGGQSRPVFAQPGVAQERLNHAERLLRMLDLLPAVDPPQDLLDRTMRRLEEPAAAAMDVQRPMAIDAPQHHA